jgi:hypothetical protein
MKLQSASHYDHHNTSEPEEAERVRAIFALFEEHRSLRITLGGD